MALGWGWRIRVAMWVLIIAAKAQAYDPDTEWRTLVSPHFHVHFPEGYESTASRVASAGEDAWEQLTKRLAWIPQTPIPIVLSEDTDTANGFAQSRPYNLVGLNLVAPEEVSELGDYHDYVYQMVAHELAHIVHIDTIKGLPDVVNTLFGRILAPNGTQPPWVFEGLATYFESELTGAGRVNSPYFDMVLRMATLEDDRSSRLLDLDGISGSPWEWPQGVIPYLYGSRFLNWIVERYGEDALRRMSHDYGGRLVPFAVNGSIVAAVGRAFPELYDEFTTELRRRYSTQQREVLSRGLMQGSPLTHRGQQIGAARLTRDGSVIFVESAINSHAAVKMLRRDGIECQVARVQDGAELALLPDGRRAVVSQIETHRVYRSYGDLFMLDLEDGSVERLTEGLRAHGPDVSADGDWLVFGQNLGLHSVIRRAPIDEPTKMETVVDLGENTQVWSPRFAPDGRQLVFAGFAHGQRDIYVVDLESRVIANLTADQAADGSPVFTGDGEWVLFHSDRDGFYNLYALPVRGGPLRRLTRVLGGAFEPEPTVDGSGVLYRTYGASGFDLAQIAVGHIEDLPPVEQIAYDSPPAVRNITQPSSRAYSSESYRPWSTILPRAWLPVVSADARGDVIGASVTGFDAVEQHRYALDVWYGIYSEVFGFSAAYTNAQFHPGFTLELVRNLGFAAFPYVHNGIASSIEEDVWTGRISTRIPVVERRDWSLWLRPQYQLQYRQAHSPIRFAPTDQAPELIDQGRFASMAVEVGFSNVHSYHGSISPEEGTGVALSFRVEDPWLGSEYSAMIGSARITQYIENPLLARQVLAISLFGAYGDSGYRKRRLFAIGGLPPRDLLLDLLNARLGTAGALRGFPVAPFVGDVLIEGHAEYRMPLFDVESGVATLPFYFRALHLAAFVDAATIADVSEELVNHQHYSAGAELRLDILLGHGLPVTLRLGFGHGLGADSDLKQVFLVMGNPF
ncbi:MAG: hypothetical protein A2289_05565 [Deltaproteobacteria bacterium RIFOXYA12_FULL_58_15]|nr:MAG: hypothetical protein A2289_05565 [Deltaproteobacteria bacterium RIFOXYA12_FULL_58_15]OGR14638.1 MAG: hypothetical protein A2341_22135 [Deltaproteobacteria bacterium RIFOXYB12_FULL_58_9]